MKRLFSKRQRILLYALTGGKCANCSTELNGKFHADHKKPFSKGGQTNILNGQALCSVCNLKKGAKLGN